MQKLLLFCVFFSLKGFSQKAIVYGQGNAQAPIFLSHKALMDKILKGTIPENASPNKGNFGVASPIFNSQNKKNYKAAKILQTNAYCNCNQTPLAVTAIQLEGQRLSDEKVQLKWTATEQTNDHKFGIERSIDAKAFTNIDFLISNNSNSESDYSYEDSNDNQAVTYYRIKESDLSGKVIYSNIVAVSGAEGESKIVISPNPSTDKISISLNSEGISNGNFTIFTVSGSQVLQKAVLFEKGKNITTIDISEFAVGTYFLQINNGKTKATKKVIKQ